MRLPFGQGGDIVKQLNLWIMVKIGIYRNGALEKCIEVKTEDWETTCRIMDKLNSKVSDGIYEYIDENGNEIRLSELK